MEISLDTTIIPTGNKAQNLPCFANAEWIFLALVTSTRLHTLLGNDKALDFSIRLAIS